MIASHIEGQLGGPGLTIECDETFLTRRKYNRGRYTHSHTIVLFGVYCRETKEGLYFRTNGKAKRDLWPLLLKYVHPEIKRICTDQAKQYIQVKTLFSASTEHTSVNHSKGEFVNKNDKENHINSIENNNKHLKSFIESRRSDKLIYQYMSMHFYFNRYIKKHKTLGAQLQQFINDVIRVYPGPSELGVTGLILNEINLPTPDSENIEHLMPIRRTLRSRKQEIITETEDEIEDMDDSTGETTLEKAVANLSGEVK